KNMTKSTQLIAQRALVIECSVESQPIPTLCIGQWLSLLLRGFDRRESPMTQPQAHIGKVIDATPIGSAMCQAVDEPGKYRRRDIMRCVAPKTSDSTHVKVLAVVLGAARATPSIEGV